eukprot:Colp12_sorted_trinity150504_noHs@20232
MIKLARVPSLQRDTSLQRKLEFADLPDELKIKVFTWLKLKDVIVASQVSKSWRALAHDNVVWSNLYFRFFKKFRHRDDGPILWREQFIKTYRRHADYEIKVENSYDFEPLDWLSNLKLCSFANISGLSRWLLVERCSGGGLN